MYGFNKGLDGLLLSGLFDRAGTLTTWDKLMSVDSIWSTSARTRLWWLMSVDNVRSVARRESTSDKIDSSGVMMSEMLDKRARDFGSKEIGLLDRGVKVDNLILGPA